MPDPQTTPPHPWEQLPGESPKQYARFLAFRGLPLTQRAIQKVKPGRKGQSGGLYRLASRNRWHDRAAAYDAWLANKAAAIREQKVLSTAEEFDKAGNEFIKKVNRVLACNTKTELEKEQEVLAILKLFVGKGGDIIGKVWDGHRALFGDKHEITGKRITLTFDE